MKSAKTDLLQGTLDMLILKTLERDPMHGFGLSRRLQQKSGDVFQFEMGSLYPALCRLEARGWIKGKWGTSEANRRARFYELTPSGQRQLKQETNRWELISSTINLMLKQA